MPKVLTREDGQQDEEEPRVEVHNRCGGLARQQPLAVRRATGDHTREAARAEAIAEEQEMKAAVAANRAQLVLAEADVPQAMAEAFRQGNLYADGQTGG